MPFELAWLTILHSGWRKQQTSLPSSRMSRGCIWQAKEALKSSRSCFAQIHLASSDMDKVLACARPHEMLPNRGPGHTTDIAIGRDLARANWRVLCLAASQHEGDVMRWSCCSGLVDEVQQRYRLKQAGASVYAGRRLPAFSCIGCVVSRAAPARTAAGTSLASYAPVMLRSSLSKSNSAHRNAKTGLQAETQSLRLV